MAAITRVYTIRLAAKMLGRTEDLLLWAYRRRSGQDAVKTILAAGGLLTAFGVASRP